MLDRLPNELVYDVFEFLTIYHILYAFKGLSARLDTVLSQYTKCDLNFISWPKSKFDFVCRSIRSEQVRSLTLSDADETCQQISLFFKFFPLRRFAHLESFILINITEQDLNKVIDKFNYLTKLSWLSISLADGSTLRTAVPSLKSLSVGVHSMIQLEQLLICAPLLTHLKVQLAAGTIPTVSALLPGTQTTNVRQLRIELAEKSNITFNDMEVLFSWMPRLEKFTFTAARGWRFIRAEQWEHLIRTYLSSLKHFHFKIHPHLSNTNISQLAATFRTPFWVTENRWLVHCDHHRLPTVGYRDLRDVHPYTLPYSDAPFYLSLSASTAADVSCKQDYRTIKHLLLSIDSTDASRIAGHFYFSDLDSLTILNLRQLIPVDQLIDLSRIQHLIVKQNNSIQSEEFLFNILVHSTNLYSLTISWHTLAELRKNHSDAQVCCLLKKQIKNVFLTDRLPNDETGDKFHAMEILSRVFSTDLEKLGLSVTSIENALAVLNDLVKLHSVSIECNSFSTRVKKHELPLSSWLARHVPRLKNCTCQIRTITDTRVQLLLWIGD